MKPILVAIIAASVFLIPCTKKETPPQEVEKAERPEEKVTPMKQVIVEELKDNEVIFQAIESDEPFLHGSLFLTDF
jgi:PBP1b-binding outer membrane lipoprotein LpoB